jgi:hypothetical protein
MLKRMSVRQAVFAVVCVLFLGVYVAAKVDFFVNYFRLGPEAYLRKHSVYWVAIAALGFCLWLVDRLSSGNHR